MPRSPRLLVLVAFLLLPAAANAQPPRPIAIDDLYLLDGLQAVTLAPNGERAIAIRQWVDARTKQERYSLWLIDGARDKARALEDQEPDARAAVFSPDGKWIAFLSTRSRPNGWKAIPPTPLYSEAATDIWLIPTAGGRAVPLTGVNKPYGRVFNDGFYGRFAFSPNGTQLVFVADDGHDPRSQEEIDADVLIVRPDQGESYTGYRPAQVWVAHLADEPTDHAAQKIERLTDDDVWYGDPQWSPDGLSLVVHANRTADRESVHFSINKNFDLWSINAVSHELRQLTTGPGPEVSPRFSADGKRVACLSGPRKGSHRDAFNLAIVTLGDAGPRTEILFDHHGPRADRPPHPSPAFPLPEDCWDDADHLVYRAALGTRTDDIRLDVKTAHGVPLENTGAVAARTARRRQLSLPVNTVLKDRSLGETKIVTWNNGEGATIEGVLTLPPEVVARAPYKLLLYPHGGPHSRSTPAPNFLVEVFAAHGYAVFQPNFRGSDGYGQKFIDADRFDFGGGDMRDILTGIDYLAREKIIDPKRQYVFGSSYGGFMTTWLVGHTPQFRAAAAQNAVTDLNSMWGLSDIQSWTEWEFGGRPWEVPAAMHKHSPITYVGNVKTPTLILHARDDRRVPLPMGRIFYQALLSNGVPTAMVIYPNEGHGIRQPRHRVDVLQRVLAWFEKY